MNICNLCKKIFKFNSIAITGNHENESIKKEVWIKPWRKDWELRQQQQQKSAENQEESSILLESFFLFFFFSPFHSLGTVYFSLQKWVFVSLCVYTQTNTNFVWFLICFLIKVQEKVEFMKTNSRDNERRNVPN